LLEKTVSLRTLERVYAYLMSPIIHDRIIDGFLIWMAKLLIVFDGEPSRTPSQVLNAIIKTISIQINRSIKRARNARKKSLSHQ